MNPNSDNYGKSPSQVAWKRLKRNKIAMTGLVFICLCCIISVIGPLVLPDGSPDANEQILELATQPPGFKIEMLKVCKSPPPEKKIPLVRLINGEENRYKYIPITGYSFKNDKIVFTIFPGDFNTKGQIDSLPLASVLFSVSSTEPITQPNSSTTRFIDYRGILNYSNIAALQKQIAAQNIITRTYWLGTDPFGRDMFSRLLLGTRISMAVGFISVFISLIVGIFLGAISGFYGGKTDSFIQWLINVVWSIPTLLLVIAISFALGRGFWQVFVAVGLTMWVDVARMVRGQILGLRETEYVQAARALGFKNARIIFQHILPNTIGPVIVISAANFSTAILLEAGLSFLGVGVQPPAPSWGVMLYEHYGYIVLNAAYLAILPGMAIMLMVLAFNLLGNGLRDALLGK